MLMKYCVQSMGTVNSKVINKARERDQGTQQGQKQREMSHGVLELIGPLYKANSSDQMKMILTLENKTTMKILFLRK